MEDKALISYESMELGELADMLREQLYERLLEFCTEANDVALRLRVREIEKTQNTEIYTSFCLNFLKQLRDYQLEKISTIVPYLKSLSDKEKSNHNCANCAHSCQVQHSMQVVFLKESHDFERAQLYRLANLTLPLEALDEDMELYAALRSRMFHIEKHLLDSRFIEETILIPQVLSAQKAINVLT